MNLNPDSLIEYPLTVVVFHIPVTWLPCLRIAYIPNTYHSQTRPVRCSKTPPTLRVVISVYATLHNMHWSLILMVKMWRDPVCRGCNSSTYLVHDGCRPWDSATPDLRLPSQPQISLPVTGTKLYRLMTEAHVCEQLAQGSYLTEERPAVELARVASLTFYHYTTTPHYHPSFTYLLGIQWNRSGQFPSIIQTLMTFVTMVMMVVVIFWH